MIEHAPLDALVDRTARALARRDPSPWLRTRVVEAIANAPADRRARSLHGIPAVMAAATAMAILTAGVLTRTPPVPSVASATLALAATPAPVTPEVGVVRLPVRARTVAAPAAATREISDAERAWHDRAIPALPSIEPLAVAVSQPDAVAIPLLSVPALTVSPVVVAPIDTARWSRER